GLAGRMRRVGARGVLERHELLAPACFRDRPALGERQHIEDEHLKLERILLGWLHELAVLIEIRHLLARYMIRNTQRTLRDPLEKIDGKNMDRGAAGPETEAAAFVGLAGHLLRQVGVFNDAAPSVDQDQVAQLVPGAFIGNYL